jgi:HEAT repeat protein
MQYNKRIRLEGYSSLLRLGENVWEELESFALSSEEKEIRMEFVLILGELAELPITDILIKIARDESYDSELRAAAIWSLNASSIETPKLIIDFCFNQDKVIANHAIAKLEKNFHPSLTPFILQRFGDNNIINAICARILSACDNSDEREIVQAYLRTTDPGVRSWILFAIGLSGRDRFERPLKKYDKNYEDTISKLTLKWDYQSLFLDNTQINAIDFIKIQK